MLQWKCSHVKTFKTCAIFCVQCQHGPFVVISTVLYVHPTLPKYPVVHPSSPIVLHHGATPIFFLWMFFQMWWETVVWSMWCPTGTLLLNYSTNTSVEIIFFPENIILGSSDNVWLFYEMNVDILKPFFNVFKGLSKMKRKKILWGEATACLLLFLVCLISQNFLKVKLFFA